MCLNKTMKINMIYLGKIVYVRYIYLKKNQNEKRTFSNTKMMLSVPYYKWSENHCDQVHTIDKVPNIQISAPKAVFTLYNASY